MTSFEVVLNQSYPALNGYETQSVHDHITQMRAALTAHCALWETWPTAGEPPICASNMSISGAARPTNDPSLCFGPG